MLKYLKIQNLAVINAAELELGTGYICLTGESGAGKSVLIEALLLLGGERASSDLVRTGCDKALVEAEFHLDTIPEELELLEDNQLFLRREVSKDGKSRAWVNGVLVPNGVLAQYGQMAFEIHGQHGQQRLLKPKDHLAMFDEQTGLLTQRQAFARAVAQFRDDHHRFWEAKDNEAARLKDIDFLKMQIMEIETVNPTEDDLALDNKLRAARNAELIAAQRAELNDLLDRGLAPDVNRAVKLVQSLGEFDTKLAPYLEQLLGLKAVVDELQSETSVWDDGDEEGDNLQALEARESAINKLLLKYGRDVNEVLQEHQRLKDELATLEGETLGLAERQKALAAAYRDLCHQKDSLDSARRQAAPTFSRRVETVLSQVALPEARFEVDIDWPPWPDDQAEERVLQLPNTRFQFTFSSNQGEPLKPLSKVASGGELSRLLLALISTFDRPSGRMLVFDEIDAGLGGETAHTIGAKLADLGRNHQVLCVTHFAQVARFAQHQIKIAKDTREGRVFTSLQLCDREGRIAELARLMGGDANAEKLRDHARQLIAELHD